jgi:hypothetical protein
VLQPNDFVDLDALEQRLLAFGRHYEQIETRFEWKFTRHDLDCLITRLDHSTEQRLPSANFRCRFPGRTPSPDLGFAPRSPGRARRGARG